MAPQVTEIAYLPLKPGANPSDPNTSEGNIWQDTLTTVLGQEGAQRAYWGTEVENPGTLRLFIDWDTLEAHKTFIKSDTYGPFVKNLLSILDGGPALYHAAFTPHPATIALSDTSAGATEVLTAYFPTSYSSADQDAFAANAKKLTDAFSDAALPGFKGASGGWVVEEIDNEKAGGKSKAYVGVLGWDSVEAHMAARNTQTFMDNIHLLKNAKDLRDLQMYHVKAIEVQKDAGLGSRERGALGADSVGSVQEEVLNPQAGQQVPPKTRSDGTTTKNDL